MLMVQPAAAVPAPWEVMEDQVKPSVQAVQACQILSQGLLHIMPVVVVVDQIREVAQAEQEVEVQDLLEEMVLVIQEHLILEEAVEEAGMADPMLEDPEDLELLS